MGIGVMDTIYHRIIKPFVSMMGMLCIHILLTNPAVFAQNVSGTVSDIESGETLPGVNVSVKGTTTGTATDAEGTYSLAVPSLKDTLVFSFVGYQKRDVPIDGRTKIGVGLTMKAIMGEDLVVVGYGTQLKSDITSAVTEIDIENVKDRPISNVSNLMQGQAPGVVAKQTTGTRGEELKVTIRGISSWGAGSEPRCVSVGCPVGTWAGPTSNQGK